MRATSAYTLNQTRQDYSVARPRLLDELSLRGLDLVMSL